MQRSRFVICLLLLALLAEGTLSAKRFKAINPGEDNAIWKTKVVKGPKPQQDEWVTCLSTGEVQICCQNCTSCCPDKGRCNLGEDNRGWGNIGNSNYGDFNFGNNSRGDCNLDDESYGIGGPNHNGCPEETWMHIVRFCTLFPYYHKCVNPPMYYGDGLMDLLEAAVLSCDPNIPVKPRQKRTPFGRRYKRSSALQRVKVARDNG